MQPRVERTDAKRSFAEPWVKIRQAPNPNGVTLIPSIPLIDLNAVSRANLSKLILKRHGLMMRLLIGDVLFYLRCV